MECAPVGRASSPQWQPLLFSALLHRTLQGTPCLVSDTHALPLPPASSPPSHSPWGPSTWRSLEMGLSFWGGLGLAPCKAQGPFRFGVALGLLARSASAVSNLGGEGQDSVMDRHASVRLSVLNQSQLQLHSSRPSYIPSAHVLPRFPQGPRA